ncbi:type II 3-dehydroquinate dehydratase [Flavobacterium sp. NKUCC04_CG]|uniref:type II 3-dehydroquinate dehydratase n=1 Tax=Flavobacterium sp. NKUCC04_CG TaxID=2842121 RepID=UPI001C5BA34D|nr:type II 3-dehydroquinate dehydratase [Flavobacterium sp. NKUCC04_CG]MBW3519426.1 type II 3-dehydroquinate dehydratase [Flavobacterium sp. NKUCC04_CG]
MRILILNGPNLNLLGTREPNIYGSQDFQSYFEQLKSSFPQVELLYYQSNIEGELIDKLHECGFSYDGIVFNAAAYTHSSIALADAISAITSPVIEVHISNTFARESFRHHSYISPVCTGVLVGFGLDGYKLAITSLLTP